MYNFKKLGIALLVILLIFAFLPTLSIDILGKFAIGWMVTDIVNYLYNGE